MQSLQTATPNSALRGRRRNAASPAGWGSAGWGSGSSGWSGGGGGGGFSGGGGDFGGGGSSGSW